VASEHRHNSPLRGAKVIPRPTAGDPRYGRVHEEYAGRQGRVHEVVTIDGKDLVKVGFDDKKVVYYLLADLEFEASGPTT